MGLPMVGKLYVLSKGDPFYCGTRAQALRCLNNGRLWDDPAVPGCRPQAADQKRRDEAQEEVTVTAPPAVPADGSDSCVTMTL